MLNYLLLPVYMYVVDVPSVVAKPGNPCVPSPCGPNSKCLEVGDSPACSCLPNYLGRPPNCRPECLSSSDCSADLACTNQKCTNPCIGACGVHTQCTVIKHNPTCQCEIGYTGDPFSGCAIVKSIYLQTLISFSEGHLSTLEFKNKKELFKLNQNQIQM